MVIHGQSCSNQSEEMREAMFSEMSRSEIVEAMERVAGEHFATRATVTATGVWGESSGGEVNAVMIPNTHTGYGATLIDISNDRRILEDFPYLVTERGGCLWFVFDDDFTTTSDDEELEDVLNTMSELIDALTDYPLYDDSDWSLLEIEVIERDWQEWPWPGEIPEIPWDEQGTGFFIEDTLLWITPELEARLTAE
jgi:hypothetical protein